MLSKYGILYSQYLQEYEPVKFQNLIMDGSINKYLEIKDMELEEKFDNILENLQNKVPKPSTNSFLNNVRYNDFIHNLASEMAINRINRCLCIIIKIILYLNKKD